MDWTQLPKELADAVEVRNRRVGSLRSAGFHVAELAAAQALVAGAPGPPLRRIPAGVEPLIEHERPQVRGHSPAVPPARPAPPPAIRQPSSANDAFGHPVPVRYSLDEAWQQGILPWKAPTARLTSPPGSWRSMRALRRFVAALVRSSRYIIPKPVLA